MGYRPISITRSKIVLQLEFNDPSKVTDESKIKVDFNFTGFDKSFEISESEFVVGLKQLGKEPERTISAA